jgi:uncharacterized ubiquitin-like protein YukD
VDSQIDDINTMEDDARELPLGPFFNVLKQNGFSVTPLQIINAQKLIMQYAGWVKNEAELCLYLSPLFAGSEDEQLLFKKLFDEHFDTRSAYSEPGKNTAASIEGKLKKHWKKLLLIYGSLALLIVIIIISTSLRSKKFAASAIDISIRERKEIFTAGNNNTTFQVTTGDKLELVTICRYDQRKTELEPEVLYDWGDNSNIAALPSHIYIAPGKYDFTAYVKVLYKNNIIKKDTIRKIINVCSSGNSLTIQIDQQKKRVFAGEKIRLSAILSNEQKVLKISWQLDGLGMGYGKKIEVAFEKPGEHSIVCTAIYDSINSPCTIQKNINLTVYDKAVVSKDTVPVIDSLIKEDAGTIINDRKKTAFLSALYRSLAGIFFLAALFFLVIWAKELKKTGRVKSKALEKYKKLSASFASKKTPAILPFRNRNYLPVQEAEINHITKLLRRRVKDNISFLHVGKTITRSIENGGMFIPVSESRTKQAEYLILIEESGSNNQQVKLFEYLAGVLKRHNVLTEIFYYRKHLSTCYNMYEPRGINLEKLYAKHQRHVLLIFGDAHQLLDTVSNSVEDYATQLHHWQHKAVITPVSYIDWQQEKSLQLIGIPVVPVDMEGMVLLAEMLTRKENDINIISRLNSNKGIFYTTAGINFENAGALMRYCNAVAWAKTIENGEPVNILFEWIAALAIYPKLRWEITLAIGKVILDKYDKRQELNFTNLLRLVRISWMQEGAMPDSLRFELLKRLSIENERMAREVLLELLKEIPQKEVDESPANFEEKELQQIINEFSLYAHDPVYFSSYKESKYLFEKLWKAKQVKDLPTELYFKNEGQQWSTLINRQQFNSAAAYNTSVEEYLMTKEKEETILSKVYLVLGLISIVVLVTSFAALRVLYIWENVL